MKRKIVAISVILLTFVSFVFASGNAVSLRPDETKSSPKDGERDYVYMKSNEGWQMVHEGRKIMVVVGNFAAYHNGTVITADSAVRYSERHIECFGNVLINRGSTYIYGDRADYNGDTNEAQVYSKIVKVVDGNATLFTYNFKFNTKSNIGSYTGGGVMISGDNLLESDRGYVYSDSHEVICVDRVQMRNKEYDMISDSVVYNTETDYAQFFTRTNIWNKNTDGKEDDYLYADKGSFDKKQQLYKLMRKSYILTEDQELLCDSLDYYRDSNYVQLKRNIQIDDRSQKMLIFGDWGEYWKEPGNVFVTKNPSLISYDTSQSDTVFMSSDSMFVYTRYPIREKIEQARRDSLAQVAKMAAADSVKKAKAATKAAAAEKAQSSRDEMARKQKEVARRKEQTKDAPTESEGGNMPPHQERPRRNKVAAPKKDSVIVADTAKVVPAAVADTVKVETETPKEVKKSRAELRRAMIDSLASDTTARAQKLRAKLLKVETAETNKAVKAAMKKTEKEKLAERKVVLAERNALYMKVLGEARAREVERKRIEKERAKRIKDSLKMVPDSLKVDSVKLDTVKLDSLKLDTLKIDSLKLDTLKIDSLKVDTLKVDTLKADSIKVDSLPKFDTMTVKQVKAYFKSIADAEKAEANRIKQDSLNAKLDRIGLARQAKRAEQYRKWAVRDSIYMAKAQERADEQLRRKLLRMEKRGIYIQIADSATLAKVDSILLADFGPLEPATNRMLDSLIDILFPKPLPSPTAVAKADSMNIDSLYREIRAYSRVKMFRSDAQTVCDSLTMTTIDSVINMYKSPVMWNGSNQISSEKMHIHTSNGELVKAQFDGKPMMVAEIDTAHYNQVAGKEMVSLFRNNEVYRNDVNGNVQTIYYMQEDNSPVITLMTYIEAGDMTSYIEKQQVVSITYRGNPVYTFYPMDKIPATQPKKLEGFKWEANRRPTQDSVFNRTIRPSQRDEKRSLRKPLFPINALLQQRKNDYSRRREWSDRTDTLTYETIEWLESLPVNYRK